MEKKQYFILMFLVVFGQMAVYARGNSEPFTRSILNSFTFDELKQAQFSLNDNLTLTRVIPRGESRGVEGGTISIVDGERVETIQIPKGTGGELMSLNRNVLGICFSVHTNRILYFSEELIGKEFFLTAKSNRLTYGQYEYKVNKRPKLMVQFSEQFIREKTTEREEGRTVF